MVFDAKIVSNTFSDMKVHLGRLLNCATTIAFGIPNQIDVCQKVMIFLHILMHLCAKISPSIVP